MTHIKQLNHNFIERASKSLEGMIALPLMWVVIVFNLDEDIQSLGKRILFALFATPVMLALEALILVLGVISLIAQTLFFPFQLIWAGLRDLCSPSTDELERQPIDKLALVQAITAAQTLTGDAKQSPCANDAAAFADPEFAESMIAFKQIKDTNPQSYQAALALFALQMPADIKAGFDNPAYVSAIPEAYRGIFMDIYQAAKTAPSSCPFPIN